jgi:hypothetical protein
MNPRTVLTISAACFSLVACKPGNEVFENGATVIAFVSRSKQDVCIVSITTRDHAATYTARLENCKP